VPDRRLVPARFLERLQDIRAGRVEPAPARDSATVALVRDHSAEGLQVFLLRRSASMAFAPGAQVFPGGSVDARDSDAAIGWTGPSPAAWGAVFAAAESLARALVCAAVRETFEESLVLLAGPTGDAVVADTRGEGWEADRRALLDRSLSFAEFLDRRGLVLRSDLLRPWARWITPAFEPRRFDTRFFVAALPTGQRARDVSTEADGVRWVRPGEAAERVRAGEWSMLPPTLATVTELAAYASVADVLAARRPVVPLQPVAEIVDGRAYLVVPDSMQDG
jgi:8-oxo-dGTP pyrophosphatase MutT (NUDIX family)